MPNIQNLRNLVAEKLYENHGNSWFTSLHTQYAYGQIQLNESIPN